MAITPKQKQTSKKAPAKATTKKANPQDFPFPKKNQLFLLKGQQGKVLDINKPATGYATILVNKKTVIIGFAELWEKIDQKKGYWTPKKVRTKYDWVALKQEFFASNYLDVAPFIQQKYSKDTASSGQVGKMTTGWAEEKRKIQEQIRLDAIKQFKSNIKGQWDAVFEKLEMAHVQGLEDLSNMILNQGKVVQRKALEKITDPDTGEMVGTEIIDIEHLMPYLYHGDITSIIKHIKLEKGEPTDILDTNGKSVARAWLDEKKNKKSTASPKEGGDKVGST